MSEVLAKPHPTCNSLLGSKALPMLLTPSVL